jgi:hypothetical protein
MPLKTRSEIFQAGSKLCKLRNCPQKAKATGRSQVIDKLWILSCGRRDSSARPSGALSVRRVSGNSVDWGVTYG